MKRFITVIALALSLASCSSTKNWESNDAKGRMKGDFEELKGKQAFKLDVPGKDKITLKYNIEQKHGELKMLVKSGGRTVLDKDIVGKTKGSLELDNRKDQKYTLIFKGKKAEGSFDVSYK